MNYDNPELLDRLAAEYVVGTLRAGARRRFESMLAGHIPLRRAVQRWEQRLFELSMQIPPVQPPREVWTSIEARIAPSQAPQSSKANSSLRTWQAIAASVAALAVILGTLLVTREPEVRVQVKVEKQAVESAHTAIVADATAPLWILNAYPQASELHVQSLRPAALAENQSFELWLLPDSGAPPISMGLLPRTGTVVLPISAGQLRALNEASKIAISIEPAGGSPTGAPTGPIPYTAALLHLRGRA
ncbi:MAG: anti-sigma factor [Steroidobacteraceae bacterium]